ncbi:MAG: Bax inhibitor-1/YccA family protein [Bacteroidota bacterium]|nr:Bax inhibitor-1/YccA family protein [Bacteroidota bacterium]MDX5429931.1 Bax inhibitor-1/YccA family protein [Bacteroidota bacterium]MDX5468704.1 Bax inhibitor-1/YccA family protein [Bacteroidota bacterium]
MDQLTYSQEQIQAEQASFISKVYGWMGVGLLLTGLVAWYTAQSEAMLQFIFGNQIVFFGLILGELALVGVLAGLVRRMSALTTTLIFLFYSALNGLTLSFVFLVYTSESISTTFFVTSLTFGIMSAYGYFTKKDLTSLGNMMGMALIGIIIASLVNMFFHNEALYWIITYVGVLVFVGLTAYDTQKIKEMNIIGNEGTDEDRKEAIMGALTLYLDFINLFLMLLRLLGNRRD